MSKFKYKFICKASLIILFLIIAIWSTYTSINISEYLPSKDYKFSFESYPNSDSVHYSFFEMYYDFTKNKGYISFFLDNIETAEYRIFFPNNISSDSIEISLYQCKNYWEECDFKDLSYPIRNYTKDNYVSIEPLSKNIPRLLKIKIEYKLDITPSGNFVLDNSNEKLRKGSQNKFVFNLGDNYKCVADCFEIIDTGGGLTREPESSLKKFVLRFYKPANEYEFRLSAVSTKALFYQTLFFAIGTGIIVSLIFFLFEFLIVKCNNETKGKLNQSAQKNKKSKR